MMENLLVYQYDLGVHVNNKNITDVYFDYRSNGNSFTIYALNGNGCSTMQLIVNILVLF